MFIRETGDAIEDAGLRSGRGSSPSAVDRVIANIKTAIRTGRYAPGQRLVETDLTEAFGVSRGSVREGLRRLAAEGIVVLERHRGASVRKMSRQDVLELNQIRETLEGTAAALAATNIDTAGRQALLAVERTWQPRDFAKPGRYGAYNTRFHDLVLELSGNRHLPLFIEQTRLSIFRLQFDFLLLNPARLKASRAEHRTIVKAILDGNAPAAEAAMRRHVRGSTAIILGAPRHFFFD